MGKHWAGATKSGLIVAAQFPLLGTGYEVLQACGFARTLPELSSGSPVESPRGLRRAYAQSGRHMWRPA